MSEQPSNLTDLATTLASNLSSSSPSISELTTTLASIINETLSVVASNLTNLSDNSTEPKLRLGSAPAVPGSSDSGSESAAVIPDHEHSRSALYAWIGLGILLIGIVFILGFVFVYDRIIRKNFFGPKDEETGNQSGPQAGPQTGNQNGQPKSDEPDEGKKPTDFVKGEANEPEVPKEDDDDEPEPETREVDDEEEEDEEKQKSRKRQEKQDENNEVELKPL